LHRPWNALKSENRKGTAHGKGPAYNQPAPKKTDNPRKEMRAMGVTLQRTRWEDIVGTSARVEGKDEKKRKAMLMSPVRLRKLRPA